jgi:hypothetical protein
MLKGSSSSLTPTSHRYFSQRLRMHYVEWGSPQNPTVVLVHGVRDHCRTWDDLIQRLSAQGNYHFVARICGDMEILSGCKEAATVITTTFMTCSS